MASWTLSTQYCTRTSVRLCGLNIWVLFTPQGQKKQFQSLSCSCSSIPQFIGRGCAIEKPDTTKFPAFGMRRKYSNSVDPTTTPKLRSSLYYVGTAAPPLPQFIEAGLRACVGSIS